MLYQPLAALAARYAVQQSTARLPEFDHAVANELIARLRQLDWLLSQVGDLERLLIKEWEDENGPLQPDHNVVLVYLDEETAAHATAPFSSQEEIRVFAEAFYYTAHRILVILDQCHLSLPGLRKISAVYIRRIRNNLLEHANKEGGRPSYTFSVSNASGIRLRSAARSGEPDVYMDGGLRNNAKELAVELEVVLAGAVTAEDNSHVASVVDTSANAGQ